MRKIILISLFSLMFFGCDSDCNCDEKMENARNTYGPPEEVNTYDSDGYHSVDYWWWSQGRNKTFTWGSYVDGCCDVSTYTFTPIADPSNNEKLDIKDKKELVEVEKVKYPFSSPLK